MKLDADKLKEDLIEFPKNIAIGVFLLAVFIWLFLGCGWIGVAMIWSDFGRDYGIIALIVNSVICFVALVLSFIARYYE